MSVGASASLGHPPGRSASVSSSWALLDLLSGIDVDGIGVRTSYRIPERISQLGADELARKVATRVGLHRFSADDLERTSKALVRTGVSAMDALGEDLTGRTFGDAQHMSAAVIAADLTRSGNTRERSIGLAALEGLQERWRAKNTL